MITPIEAGIRICRLKKRHRDLLKELLSRYIMMEKEGIGMPMGFDKKSERFF